MFETEQLLGSLSLKARGIVSRKNSSTYNTHKTKLHKDLQKTLRSEEDVEAISSSSECLPSYLGSPRVYNTILDAFPKRQWQ